MSSPHDGPGGGRRRRAGPPQRPASERPQRPAPPEPPQRPVSGDQPDGRDGRRPPDWSPPRKPRHAAPEPAPRPPAPRQPSAPRQANGRPRQAGGQRQGELGDLGDLPEPAPPRRPRPPARRAEPAARRRRSANEGVPPDENPTEILDLGYDDLFDEGVHDRDEYDDTYDAYDEHGDHYYDDEDDEYDEYDERALPEYFDDERDDDPPEPEAPRKRGKRFLGWLAALIVIVLLAGGAYYGARELLGFGFEDYPGPGENDVVLQVEDGDSTRAIATKLENLDVVASSDAFVNAAEDDQRILGIQPGYYAVKTKMSGAGAVGQLVRPGARVGVLQLRAGTQLDDITQPDGKVTPGVFSQLSKASCADLNGESTCVSAEKLRETASTADLAKLGVPEWAVADVNKADPKRKLEGIIQPGVYDVKPGWNATQLLSSVLETSTVRMQAAGLPDAAGETGRGPYEILTVASIIEREGVKTDFEKVARVIYNRLDEGMRLEMDSTVNYVLDRPEIRTNRQDRARAGPYNTYQREGLPPTPISAPSMEAIEAAESPAQGPWLYFVKCETNGLSCFSASYDEHRRNVEDAQRRGVF